MHMERITAPAAPLISLAEAKAHLRVTHLNEDDLIAGYIAATEDYLDGFSGTLGRALQTQTWRLHLRDYPASEALRLPLAPFQSVTSVKYDGEDYVERTHDPALYRVIRDAGFGVIEPKIGQTWPATVTAVRVEYVVGHDAANPMPRAIRAAALLLIGALYDNRAAEVEGRIITHNPAVERLLAPYRVRSW